MNKIIKLAVFTAALIISGQVSAGPLQGKSYFVDPGGNVFNIADIEGYIDVGSNYMTVSPWGPFFGQMFYTESVEILPPGNYTRTAGTVTVPADHVGANMQFSWGGNTFDEFMVWQVTSAGTTFNIIDSDGDGIPGHAFTNGPFPGFTMYYEFTTTPQDPAGPNVFLTLEVAGGHVHECTADSRAEVTVNAVPALVGGAVLESISWTVDGEDAGTGFSISESLSLGSHHIAATALTTTGQSDIEIVGVQVRDTTRPVVNVAFIDGQGNEVESAGPGQVEISIKATDTCDPNPVITSGTAKKSTLVSDGDIMMITGNLDNLKLPTTAINVTATAKDASGNFSLTTSESSKTLTLE